MKTAEIAQKFAKEHAIKVVDDYGNVLMSDWEIKMAEELELLLDNFKEDICKKQRYTMTIEQLKPVIDFLKLNGFKKMEKGSYANDMCNVKIEEYGYAVADNDGGTVYSEGFNIYWLIGILTYLGYMDKNYNQF